MTSRTSLDAYWQDYYANKQGVADQQLLKQLESAFEAVFYAGATAALLGIGAVAPTCRENRRRELLDEVDMKLMAQGG